MIEVAFGSIVYQSEWSAGWQWFAPQLPMVAVKCRTELVRVLPRGRVAKHVKPNIKSHQALTRIGTLVYSQLGRVAKSAQQTLVLLRVNERSASKVRVSRLRSTPSVAGRCTHSHIFPKLPHDRGHH